jgi:hypothetical protein
VDQMKALTGEKRTRAATLFSGKILVCESRVRMV